jgi:hypothetical protein
MGEGRREVLSFSQTDHTCKSVLNDVTLYQLSQSQLSVCVAGMYNLKLKGISRSCSMKYSPDDTLNCNSFRTHRLHY